MLPYALLRMPARPLRALHMAMAYARVRPETRRVCSECERRIRMSR